MTDQHPIVSELQRCKPMIERAMAFSGDTHEYVDIVDGVLCGRFHMWPTENSCLITEILVYPRKRVLHVFLAGGELQEILNLQDSLIQFGKENGCSSLTMSGRKGWLKALDKLGWGHSHTTMEKRF